MSLKYKKILEVINSYANLGSSDKFTRFFKTDPGQYSEHDIFLGITVPDSRKIANEFSDLGFEDLLKLLKSIYHEHRAIALFIMIIKFNKGDEEMRSEIVQMYLKNISYINNWDLVDLSASKILGRYLINKPRAILYSLARSKNIWERRISIISTFAFLNNKEELDTIKISEILLKDKEDLIHKAVGWALREMGKKCSEKILESFLEKHYSNMNRTTLRYCIERLDLKKKIYFMNKK